MSLTDKQRALREGFVDTFGYWDETWEGILVTDEAFFEAYVRLGGVPWKSGHLSPKEKELVHIAVDSASTHLYAPGIRQHIRNALKLGASREEVMEVLELTATLGIHACNIGVPILVEELGDAAPDMSVLTPRQEEIKADFVKKRGYWNPFWDEMLALDPEFFDSYTVFSSVPWVSGTLSPKMKEFIYTAFDVAATHLYVSGLHQHVQNALRYGATREELIEVFQIASLLGVHACNVGVPVLLEELRSLEKASK
jgi:alkylhydroperoxidase/carboxymuconolactone decarboxylase family protein YurZ